MTVWLENDCPPEHYKGKRILKSFAQLDSMSPELRQCVHEFGLPIVHAMVEAKVTDPRRIRALVHQCWMGARQHTQKNGKQEHSTAMDHLDWLLIQAGAGISAATLLRVLAGHDMIIVTREPSEAMVDASIDAVNHMGVVSKRVKHRNRLRAAIEASTKRLWPHLTRDGERRNAA